MSLAACSMCGAATKTRCSRCNVTPFCSQACIAAAWKDHKARAVSDDSLTASRAPDVLLGTYYMTAQAACKRLSAVAADTVALTLPPSDEILELKRKLCGLAGAPPPGAPHNVSKATPLPRTLLVAARVGALTRAEMAVMKLEALQAGELVSAANERKALDAVLAAVERARARHPKASQTLDAVHAAVFALHTPQPGNAELSASLAAAAPELEAAAAAAAAELAPRLRLLGLSPAEVDAQLADVTRRIRLSKIQALASEIGTRERGEPPEANACAAADAAVTSEAMVQLSERGYAVIDDALNSADAEALRVELHALLNTDGALKPVAVQASVGTRTDVVRYAHPDDAGLGAATVGALRLLRGLAHALQHAAGDALPRLAVPRNCMIACYPGGGARYVAHRDNAPSREHPHRNRRAVTAILYANEADWDPVAHGGCLRCHLAATVAGEEDGCPEACAGADGTCHADVAPRPGRLVLFRSDALLHEVMPAHARRFALSIWLLEEALPDAPDAT